MSTQKQSSLTPIELAKIAAILNNKNTFSAKDAIKHAQELYEEACEVLKAKKSNDQKEDPWNGHKKLLEFLDSLIPKQTNTALRQGVIEFRCHQLQDSKKASGEKFTRKDAENHLNAWEKDESWKSAHIDWKCRFVRFYNQRKAEIHEITQKQEREYRGHAKGGRVGTGVREHDRWIRVFKTGEPRNKVDQEALDAVAKFGEDAEGQFRKYLNLKEFAQCVLLVKERNSFTT